MANHPSKNNGIHVPADRTLADMPKSEPKPTPQNTAKPPNTRLTLKEFLTENEAKNYLVTLLDKLGKETKKGPWKEYLEFYRVNLSGDFDSMKPEIQKYCEKMKKELNDKYFEAQEL